MKKQLMAVLLTVCMLLTTMSVSAAAASDNNPFTDVSAESWYHDDVQYVYDEGLMSGMDTALFAPDVTTTRGMIVTILWRMEGSPVVSGTGFADVNANAYYANAILWASENEIILGCGDDTFCPDKEITRECMALILYRYADYAGYKMTETADLDDFADADKISSYAKEALEKLCGAGLISGMGDNMIVPQGSATRAQIAALLHRFCAMLDSAETKDEYTVTFDYNYSDKGTYKTLTVANGKTVTAPKSPSRTGYTFDGWFTKAEDGKEFDFDTEITKDITLYAQWTKRNTSTISGSVTHDHNYRTYEYVDNDMHKAICSCGDYKTVACTYERVDNVDTCKYCGNTITYYFQAGDTMCVTLADAFTAAADGDTITVIDDITETDAVANHADIVITEKDVTLDLNGKTVNFDNTNNGTDDSPLWTVFYVKNGSLTVTDSSEEGTGAIEYNGKNTMLVWADTDATVTLESGNVTCTGAAETAMQVFYANNNGKIYVTGGTYTNSINEMFNVQNGSAATISVCGGTFSSFNEYDDADSAKANSFVANGYKVVYDETAKTYTIECTIETPVAKIGLNIYATLNDALNAADEGDTVTLLADVPADRTEQIHVDGFTLDGNGYSFNAANVHPSNDYDCAVNIMSGTVKNLTITGSFRAIGTGSSGDQEMTGDVCIDKVTVDGVTYAFNTGIGNGYNLTVTNSTLNGWISYADMGDVTFTNCTFSKGTSTHCYIKPYNDTTFTNCTFAEEFAFGVGEGDLEITYTDCTWNGHDSFADGVLADTAFSSEYNATVIVDDDTLFWNASEQKWLINGVYHTSASSVDDLVTIIENATVPTSITLAANTYTASKIAVDSSKDITIVAADGADVTFDGRFHVTGKLTLKDITVTNENASTDSVSKASEVAIGLYNEGEVICENVTFDITKATGITSWWSTGEQTNVVVKNCVFNCNGNRPLQIEANATIEGCTFNDPYRYAVQLTSNDATINFKNNTINKSTDNGKPVYAVQLTSDYGNSNLVINGSDNTINRTAGTYDDALYVWEPGTGVSNGYVDIDTITLNATDGELVALIGDNLYVTDTEAGGIPVETAAELVAITNAHATAVIKEDTTIALDNTVTINASIEAGAAIINNGTLTIDGATIYNDANADFGSHVIVNTGKLTIESGTFGSDKNSGNAVNNKGGEVIINGGTFSSADRDAYPDVWAYAFTSSGGSITINNATVNCKANGIFGATNGATITVNGGTYELQGAENNYYVCYAPNGTINLVGGSYTYHGSQNCIWPVYVGTDGSVTVSDKCTISGEHQDQWEKYIVTSTAD